MSKLLPALCALAGHLPLGLLQRTGAVAGWLGLRVSKRFARLTGTNLEQAGLAANPRDYKHLVATSAVQTGMGAMELAIAWGRDVDGIARLVRRCEGWEAVEASLAAGRGLLFVTPEHNRSVPAYLKNALDGASRPYGSSAWAGIPAAVIGTSGGGPATSMAQQHLRNVLSYLDMPTMCQPEGFIRWSDELLDAQGHVGEGSKVFLTGFMHKFLAWVAKHPKG